MNLEKAKAKNQKPKSDTLRILILEDVPTDAELMERELRKTGLKYASIRVDTRDAFLKELGDFSPDIVLSDYSLPRFTGLEAIGLVKERFPLIPIIIVTGSLSEVTAVECMKAGAADYVLKDNLVRLSPALQMALEKKQLREEKGQAEEALRESEEKYRTILESIEDGYFEVDLTGNFKFFNDSMCKIRGYSKDELIVMNNRDYMDPETSKKVYEIFNRVYKTGESVKGVEWESIRKDGSKIYSESSISLMKDSKDQPIGFQGIVRDITERKNLEKQLIQSQKMEAVGRLAGGVAHDFNNLMTIVIGNADMLLMSLTKDDPLREDVEEIKKAGGRSTSLTRQLLAFSRRQVLQPMVLNLNTVLAETDKMLRRLIGEDLEMATILESELGKVNIDPGQVEQVIMNLAINARDAMPGGGKFTIETANVDLDREYAHKKGVMELQPGPYVMLAISDKGIGMDKETQSQIFDPFFTTKPKAKGTGLGLSTVYGIVKQSGGYIWVYSEPGQGTTFKIYLPRVQGEEASLKKEPVPKELLQGSETVLMVEDDEAVRNFSKKVLKRSGYNILEAQDGEEALMVSRAHEGPIHLLLTDVVMPKMSGRELADRLQELRPETKVLFMSGYTDNAIIRHGTLRSDVNFMQKPFTPELLSQRIRRILDRETPD